jgi:hypothetical protein
LAVIALVTCLQVFTWGRGKYGQLGHGSTQNEAFPVSVTALTDQMIVQIICGGHHTMAINGDGVLFSWGQGHWGQTGVDSKEDVLAPKQVTALEGKCVKQGSAGARHSIVLTDDGEIYGWGDNEQGQLGELARFGLQLLRIRNPFRCLLMEFCAECRTEVWNCLIVTVMVSYLFQFHFAVRPNYLPCCFGDSRMANDPSLWWQVVSTLWLYLTWFQAII